MGRIKGASKTEFIRPTVKLVSSTNNIVGTLVALWIGSRYEHSVDARLVQLLYEHKNNVIRSEYTSDLSDEFIVLAKYLCECYPEHAGEDGKDYKNVIKTVARMVIDANLPPSDAIIFTFEIDNANVAWRDQLVRGRGNFQNYWTQTSRTADLTTIDVNMSESIGYYGGEEAEDIYKHAVQTVRDAYVALAELGVPTEDIRLAPQGMTHRVYWIVGLRTLLTIIPKRTSWIAQASLWSPIIEDIQKILNQDEVLSSKFGTPLDVKIKNSKIVAHTYDNENEDRYYGKDPQPTDPLWLAYKGYDMPEHTDLKFYDKMKSYYINLWNEEVCSIVGWDKKNPDKLGPYDRPKSWFESTK